MRIFRGRKRAFSILFGAAFALTFASPGDAAPERIKAWVTLRDKGPAALALSGRAFEDAPVHVPYLDALRAAGFEVSAALKWQNKVSGWLDDSRAGAVRALPFVRSLEEMPRKAAPAPDPSPAPPVSSPLPRGAAPARASAQDFGAFQAVFDAVGAGALRDTLARRGLAPGAGVRIAFMDDGFRLGHKAFDSLFARAAIADQWDFVRDSASAVDRSLGASHGAATLSQVAGDLPGIVQGLAPRARFLLYRTEDEDHEGYVEEDYLAAAIERAVDSGAQVINISLSYRYDFDSDPEVPYSAMDGRTRPSSLAALGAARRGALVAVAIGNEGNRKLAPNLAAPADADSILAVGIANASGVRCGYASSGPSFDGRVKPELVTRSCGVPTIKPTTLTEVYDQTGTSFASPIVAGVAALLRQLHPDNVVEPQRIRLALLSSAARSGPPDAQTGYGAANAVAAHELLRPRVLLGVLAWRAGAATLPWANVDPSRARLWDALGRERRVRAGWTPEGNILIEPSSGKMAQGAYLLRIPKGAVPETP